ncbi:uncharacterized protein LOC144149242 [Haemaphysalis longicornis]
MFAVVRFLSDSTVDVVPTKWLLGDECFWPGSYKASRAIKAIKHCEDPDSTYQKHPVVVLSIEDGYEKARMKLKRAEDTDDLATTDQDKGRGKRKKYRTISSSESDFEEGLTGAPPPPFAVQSSSGHEAGMETVVGVQPLLSSPPASLPTSSNASEISSVSIRQEVQAGAALDNSLLILREICGVKQQLKAVLDILSKNEQGMPKDDIIPLPLKTEEEVTAMETKLRCNAGFSKQLVHQLAGVGGTTPQLGSARVLAQLFMDSIGQQFSLFGQKGKKPFAHLELFNVTQKAVRLMKGMNLASLQEIQSGIQGWLKNCPARLRNASQRKVNPATSGLPV